MNQEYKLYRISQLLSRFKEQVKILNSNGEFSINIHAENILLQILNKIYDCNLKNVNYQEGKMYSSIDLRDEAKRLAIQVTSTADFEKIRHTLIKFIEKRLPDQFDRLLIFLISDKKEKYSQTKIDKILKGRFTFSIQDILDQSDIYTELNSQNNMDKINFVEAYLERQFSDNKEDFTKWDLYCKGLFEYDQYIQNLYKYLDIKGFSPRINNTLVKISLENIYVPLELRLENNEERSREFVEHKERKFYSVDKAVNDFGKLVILGDPGSGKSTVLRYLAYSLCSKRIKGGFSSDLVPLLIKGAEFSKYVYHSSKSLSEYIIDHLDKRYELLFTQKLEEGQLLLLVDGIDEINVPSLKHDVVNRINAFIAQYPKIKIVVSSRIIGYRETRLNGNFSHLEVSKFSDDQIRQFVNNWYSCIFSDLNEKESYIENKAKELYLSIRENYSVLKMATNPLLVTIIALIHYQGSTLPEKRASLYDIATSTFLEHWVKQRDTKRNSILDKDLLIEILAPISFYIHLNYSTGLITEKELKGKLTKKYMEINPYTAIKDVRTDIKDMIEFLREDAGFLYEKGFNEEGEPMFGFVHQTFQEYFTAIEFKTLWKEGKLSADFEKYIFSSNWLEVIKLTASLFKLNEPTRLGRQNATIFLRKILNVNDPYPEIFRPLKIAIYILKDDTEIEFTTFSEIIDKVFIKVLNNLERPENSNQEYDSTVSLFKFLLGELIDTKTYQSYLIERIIKEVEDEAAPKKQENLIHIMMRKSKLPSVREGLIKILNSDNKSLKKCLFDYSTVWPAAEIVDTEEFITEILKYINSADFLKQYTGFVPTQYPVCFDAMRKRNSDILFSRELYDEMGDEVLEEWLQSIRYINNKRVKKDLIHHYIFSIGTLKIEGIIKFTEHLRREYPKINLAKIEEYVRELKEFESNCLEEHEITNYMSVKIFAKKGNSSIYAFVRKKKISYLKFPFTSKDLLPYFKSHSDRYSKFLSLIIPRLDNLKKTFDFNSENLSLFIEFGNTLNWFARKVEPEGLFNFALASLFDENGSVNEVILKWIINRSTNGDKITTSERSFNKQIFIDNVLTSKLDLHHKLYLLYIINDKTNFEVLLKDTIIYLRKEPSEEKKKEIGHILREVLA